MSETLEKENEPQTTTEEVSNTETKADTTTNDSASTSSAEDTTDDVATDFSDDEQKLIDAYRKNDIEAVNAILGREPESKNEDIELSHGDKYGFNIDEVIPEDIKDDFVEFSKHELWTEIQGLANPEDLSTYARELALDMKRDDFGEVLKLTEALRPTKKLALDAYLEASKTVAERTRLNKEGANTKPDSKDDEEDDWIHLSGEARKIAFQKALRRKGIR